MSSTRAGAEQRGAYQLGAANLGAKWPIDVQTPWSPGVDTGQAGRRAARVAAAHNYTHANLPVELARRSLRLGTSLGEPRFLPRPHGMQSADGESAFDEIFMLWNELDELMWNASRLVSEATGGGDTVGRKHAWQTGYVRELQLRRMVGLVRSTNIRTYCEVRRRLDPAQPVPTQTRRCCPARTRHSSPEQRRRLLGLLSDLRLPTRCPQVGMNGGHSVAAMLLANPRLQAHVFDWMILKYSHAVAARLTARFGERFKLIAGNSRVTLRPWADRAVRSGNSTCDLIFVDGDHDAQGARTDLQQMRRVAACHNRLVVDDLHIGPGSAVLKEQ
jgi:hypothetical protein